MATHRSNLLGAFEYFWNQHWSTDPRIKLIISGSSASWIIKNIINNRGGLHNRITQKIHLQPFNLHETKSYLLAKKVKLKEQQITELYMVTGGVPYYLSKAQRGLSIAQIIEELAFTENSLLLKEFDKLLSSLFKDARPYVELLRIIAKNRYGINQDEILEKAKLSSKGGSGNEKLEALEEAGFLLSFTPHFNEKRGTYFRIIDEYTMFYLKWIEPIRKTLQKSSLEPGDWEQERNSAAWKSWPGYAFESICYKHISQIRKALNISPGAIANTWRFIPKKSSAEDGAQVDLLFDRKDGCITLVEIKYTDKPFLIDKPNAKNILNKQNVFVKRTKTKKKIIFSMVSANGLKDNLYADDLIDGVVVLADLFKEKKY